MSRHTLYAYVEGSDLLELAGELENRFRRFVADSTWHFCKPSVVNQIHPTDDSLRPGDLPDWDLGLNLDLPDPGEDPPGWFSDVEQIARFLGELRGPLCRNFVIGIGDNQTGISEDLFFVTSRLPDLDTLRQIIGANDERA